MAKIQEIYINSCLFGTFCPPLPVANVQQFPLSSLYLSDMLDLQERWRSTVRVELKLRIFFRTVDMTAIK